MGIERLIDLSVKNRFLIFIFALLLIGVGLYSMNRLPIDAVPDITNVQVQVQTKSPALGPLEVEQFITYPVEAAMTGLPNVEEIRSISRYGISSVTIVFKEHVDIYFARQLVQERLVEAKENIPAGFGVPEMGPATTGLGEVYHFTLEGEGYTPLQLRTLLDWEVAYRLRSIPGVIEVNAWGGLAKQFQVAINPKQLISYGIALKDIFEAIKKNNKVVGSAYIERFQEQLLIRGEGLVKNKEDLENIVITIRERSLPIRIKDLATVRIGSVPRLGAATKDGEGETVSGMVQMLIGENARTVTRRVDKKVAEIQGTLPKGVRIVPFYNRTDLVDRTIRTVTMNLFEGGMLVIAVLFLLLGNIRAAFLVAAVIPLSMLFAFIGMATNKISGNLMSLGAIDFGLLVDGAIVMVENIIRRLNNNPSKDPSQNQRTLLSAAKEVARPVLFGVGIIIIVYLPILTLQGTEGRMFKPMAFTVVFALSASLLLAFTLVPSVCSVMFRKGAKEKEPKFLHFIKDRYEHLLNWVLKRKTFTLLVALFCFIPSVLLFPFLGGEFIPSLDEGDIALQAWRYPSISIQESVRTTLEMEKVLKKFPEVKTVVSRTGTPEVATDVMGIELSDIFVILHPKEEWITAQTKEELIGKMEEALKEAIPGVGYGFTQPIEMRFNELISGVRSDVAVKIFGPDLEILNQFGEKAVSLLSQVPGARDVRMEQVTGLPVLRIKLDRKKMAPYGINVDDALNAVEAIQSGRVVGTVFEGVKRFEIAVKFDLKKEFNLKTIENLPVFRAQGQMIPLGQIADIKIEAEPAQISREFGQRRLVVECNVRGADIQSFIEQAQSKMDQQLNLPSGYYLEWGGTFEQLSRAKKRLFIVVPIALFLIFVLLYTSLGSVRQALLVYTGIPLAAIGGIVSLYLRGIPFSISAGVGFIALFGIAVLNGLVMVSYISNLRKQGKELNEAIVEGALTRFRPVLMTALVASLGFIPMALSHSAGAEVQRPLATVVIGGLISSTLLTLVVLPVLYALFEKKSK